MSTLDLRELLAALVAHDVDFVVVGAVAVAAHGYVRGTADLDLVPNPDPENLHSLRQALTALEAKLPLSGDRAFDPGRDARPLERGQNVTLDTRAGGLDVIQRVPGLPRYDALVAESIEADLLGVPVHICSLRHLRAMKRAAGRPQDEADLANLPDA